VKPETASPTTTLTPLTTASPPRIACTLTPSDYAERLREFRRLFATSLRDARREPTRLHLDIDPDNVNEEGVRDLLRREQECCPFLSFTIASSSKALHLQVAVPDDAGECLNDLERLATSALRAKP
jgi:hypothetical protein